MAVDWRADPDLVRREDEDEVLTLQLQAGWAKLFTLIDRMTGELSPWDPKSVAIKGFASIARRMAAADPSGTRATVLQSVQLACAALEFEPLDVFPELTAPAAPHVHLEVAPGEDVAEPID